MYEKRARIESLTESFSQPSQQSSRKKLNIHADIALSVVKMEIDIFPRF
jgi:hypothetical protein